MGFTVFPTCFSQVEILVLAVEAIPPVPVHCAADAIVYWFYRTRTLTGCFGVAYAHSITK